MSSELTAAGANEHYVDERQTLQGTIPGRRSYEV
jgi:hypothetical protein